MLWVAMVVALFAIAGLVLLRRKPEPYVIGERLADAAKAEEARLAQGPVGPSPVPSGEYDAERGDFDLVSVSVQPFDAQLQGFVRDFRSWDAEAVSPRGGYADAHAVDRGDAG